MDVLLLLYILVIIHVQHVKTVQLTYSPQGLVCDCSPGWRWILRCQYSDAVVIIVWWSRHMLLYTCGEWSRGIIVYPLPPCIMGGSRLPHAIGDHPCGSPTWPAMMPLKRDQYIPLLWATVLAIQRAPIYEGGAEW